MKAEAKQNYLIETADNAQDLQRYVQDSINKGFVPQGGMVFCDFPPEDLGRFRTQRRLTFSQAMYRKPAPKKTKAKTAYPPEFESLWILYPKRNGSNPKIKAYAAYCARRKEGRAINEILDGLYRYSKWCDATHKTGTETVMQAARFFGPGLEFMNDWALPEETAATLPKDNEDLEAYAKRLGMTKPGPYPNESWNEYRKRIERAKKHIEQGLGSKPGQ